jgi:TolB-like protein
MPGSRQLAAIMFTDIVGFTALMGSDEEKTFKILEKNRAIHKPIITQYRGKWIKELGDGVMASFNNITDAVNAAIAIQETCNAANEYQLSIGIHSAEVVFENDDVFGNGVNIAARIQSAAPSGCIFISEAVYNNIANNKKIKTHFVKAQNLKNVSKAIRLYQVLYAGSEILKAETIAAPPVEKSIAVLPFVNMSSDPEQEYFSDGISEEIINLLAQVEQLKVIGRTSSFAFKGMNMDLKVIGEQLDVNHLLEGSVRKAGNKLRVTAQLIEVSSGFHLYSEKFDRELEDVFAIQDEIAEAILKATKIRLFGEEKVTVSEAYSENIEAYKLYLKGLYFQNKLDLITAIDYYEAALSIDPNYVVARAKISMCYFDMAFYGFDPENNLRKCQSTLDKAADLDDKNADYMIAKGRMEFWYHWDFERAGITLEKALRINPNIPEGLKQMGALNMCLGRFSEGHMYLDKAEELDPFSLIGLTYIGAYYFWEKDYNKVIEYGNRIISMEPNAHMGHSISGVGHFERGEYEEAILNLKKAIKLAPNPDLYMYSFLGRSYACNNEPENAKEVLKQMEGWRGKQGGGYSYFGYLYADLKDWDQAITNLEMAVKHREGYMLFFHVSSIVSHPDMKENPRIEKLKERLGLPVPN